MAELLSMLGLPLLACLAIVAAVGHMGLHVLKREVIFIDIALAQMAAVGVIILAVRIAGVVVVFCFLIIPATTSAIFSSKWGVRLLLTWLFGAVASLLGLVFAYCLDFSLGPSVALFSGLVLIVCGVASRSPRPRPVATLGICLLALVDLSLLTRGPPGPRDPGVQPCCGAAASIPRATPAGQEQASDLTDERIADLVAKAGNVAELERLFAKATGPQVQSDIVSRAIALDKRTGAVLLLRFLRTDPPIFFRAVVLEGLEEATDEPAGFDSTQDFGAAVNQEAAAKLIDQLGTEQGSR